ncbi:hypothetical protein TNCV_1606481 [Trichonephila clavipes]|nr:hypothetical protein TNCV_1606481 [Trichonephila clavipes]
MTYVSSSRRKEPDPSQKVPLLSNCVEQQCDKCRCLLWLDAFPKVDYSSSVLSAATFRKWDIGGTFQSDVRSTKAGYLINGVVSSLRLRVVSVPQAILNAS